METRFPKDSDDLEVLDQRFSFREIATVVSAFYKDVSQDPMLSVPFASVHDWPHHIERLTHFWWVRLGGDPYLEGRYNPVEKHFAAGFNQSFLKQWLELFGSTLEKHLAPEKARLWLGLATNMGRALSAKNEFYARHHGQGS